MSACASTLPTSGLPRAIRAATSSPPTSPSRARDAPVDKALRLDTNVMLVDDPVKRVDNMTMAWGLEARVPFLDHELVELAARIPAEPKLADGGKGVLKDAARLVVPQRGDRPQEGLFPGTGAEISRRTLSRDGAGRAWRRSGAGARPVPPELSRRLFAAAGGAHHATHGSELWQVGLLEMWLQTNGI